MRHIRKHEWIVLLVVCVFAFTLLAQETLTLTTYYPAPYGVYVELRSKRMAIGNNYFDPSAYPWKNLALV